MELSKKTKALLFREFRLSKKSIIITLCLCLGFSLIYSVPFIYKLTDPAVFEGFDIRIIIGQMIYLLPVMWILPASGGSTTGMEDVLKKDADSGWLIYSYTLPITPRERADVRFGRRMVLITAAAVMSVICVIILCAMSGCPYEPEMICPVFITLAFALVNMCITEYFILSARIMEEMKKAYTKAGFITMALMAGIIAAVFAALNSYIKSDAMSDEIIISMPMPPLWTLFISLPVSAAAAYAVYRIMLDRMSSAYPIAAAAKEKSFSDNMEAKTITSGYVYMQIARNKKPLILSALMPLMMKTLFTAAYTCFSLLDSEFDEKLIFSVPMRILAAVLSVVIVSAFTSSTFEGDKKLWSYFVCASPQGVRGYLYSEYLVCIAMAALATVGGVFAENLFDTVSFLVTGEEAASLSSIYIEGFFVFLLIAAADIPLMIRFGPKKGSYIKTIAGIALAIIGTAVIASENEGVMELIAGIYRFISGEETNDALLLIITAFPLCGILACAASFFVSKKLYMKGVNDYERG